jgi:hypothetical protein
MTYGSKTFKVLKDSMYLSLGRWMRKLSLAPKNNKKKSRKCCHERSNPKELIYRFKLLLSYRLKMFKKKKNNRNTICLAIEHFQKP